MYQLREIDRNDIIMLNEWRNDSEIIDYLGAPFRYINKEVDYAWYDSYIKSRNSAVRCAILDENEVFIGVVSLVNIDYLNQSAEFHIMIGNKQSQNKGAGQYATLKMLEHAFNNLNIQRIELTVLDTNTRAIHMYEKLGFKHEGTKRKARFKHGQFIDMRLYSVLREDFIC